LPALVVNVLKAYRVRQLQERLAAGGNWAELDFVFPTSLGTPMDPRNVNRVFTAVLTLAAVTLRQSHRHFHQISQQPRRRDR
jgi:integrase